MSAAVAGLIAGIPLAFVLGIYVLVRGRELVQFFRSVDERIGRIPEKNLLKIILVSFIGAAFLLGLAAGLIYRWFGIPVYHYLAVGGVVVLSVLAILSRQPLIGDKLFWNLSVGIILGGLVPWIA
jgi:hypothetical protein